MLAWLPPGVELMTDVSAADWVVERLRPWEPDGARLRSFAPEGFEAYVRVFHPAGYRPARRGSLDPSIATKWADLAQARAITLSPDISFSEVSGIAPEDQQGLDELGPLDGELPPETCDALAAVLRSHTPPLLVLGGERVLLEPVPGDRASPRRDARGDRPVLDRRSGAGRAPRLDAASGDTRPALLPLHAACTFEPSGSYTSPNLWWPDDRAWIVVTEIDGFSTYVGGSRAAIQDVLASPDLEAVEVTLDTHMDPGAYRPRVALRFHRRSTNAKDLSPESTGRPSGSSLSATLEGAGRALGR